MAGSVALVGILVLLALLVQKELANAAEGQRFHSLSQALNLGIAPPLIAFAVVAYLYPTAIGRSPVPDVRPGR